MKIYHGTTKEVALDSVKNGLKPRGENKSNWEKNPSRSDCVYLTTAYPLHFATCSAKTKEEIAIIEIDFDRLNEDLLLPDEDFLEQASRNKTNEKCFCGNGTIEYRTNWYKKRLEKFSEMWLNSLTYLGNCSYKGTIEKECITNVAFISQKKCSELIMLGLDPIISITNFRLVGSKYIKYNLWLFNDSTPLNTYPGYNPMWDSFSDFLGKNINKYLDRNGIELLR